MEGMEVLSNIGYLFGGMLLSIVALIVLVNFLTNRNL